LAAAAVHGGFLKPGQRGILHVSILPARGDFRGSTSNGVTSMTWGNHLGSFRINRLVRLLDTGISTANSSRRFVPKRAISSSIFAASVPIVNVPPASRTMPFGTADCADSARWAASDIATNSIILSVRP